MSKEAEESLKEVGIAPGEHASRLLTPSIVEWADFIYCMEPNHLRAVEEAGGEGKAELLGQGLEDPYGQGLSAFRETREVLFKCVDEQVLPAVRRRLDP